MSSQPHAVCVFAPLVDLDRTKGFPPFWPGSHKHKGLVWFGSTAKLVGTECDALGRAGDAILHDCRTLHRGRCGGFDSEIFWDHLCPRHAPPHISPNARAV